MHQNYNPAPGVNMNIIINPKFVFSVNIAMLAAGIYFSRRGYMSISLPLREVNYRRYLEAFGEFMETSAP